MEWDGLMEDRSKNNKIETKDKSEGPEAEVGEEVFYGDTFLESALAFSCPLLVMFHCNNNYSNQGSVLQAGGSPQCI